MKLVFIFGDGAVGKMTVGQQLMKLTGLRLFHNHMTIEPVLDVFGRFDSEVILELRETIFRHFAASDLEGMIYTQIMAFDVEEEWKYLEHIKSIFEPYGTQFYYVELIAPQEVRLKRNATENRLKNKPSKRNIEASRERIVQDDLYCRCVSEPGEFPFRPYLRIENSDVPPEKAAEMIRDTFGL